MRQKKYTTIFGFFVMLAIIASNIWTLDARNFFMADDYVYLNAARFIPFSKMLYFLPVSRYDDRPVGNIIIKLFYQFFNLNAHNYYISLLLIHLFNCFLVYLLVKKILIEVKKQDYKYLPILTAAIFGMWPKSLHAVSWTAAIFDLFGATLLLLIFNLFVYRNNLKWKYFVQGLMIVLFFLALRTKEMTIIAPALIIIYEIFLYLRNNREPVKSLKHFRPSGISVILFLISIGYFLYLTFMTNQAFTLNPSDQYYFTYNPLVMIKNFLLYWYLYFDFSKIEGAQDIFVGFNMIYAAISFSMLAVLLVWSLFQAFKKNYTLLFIFAALFISLLPVLPLKNFQHILYLYFPSIFFSLLLAIIVTQATNKYVSSHLLKFIVMVVAVGGLYSLTFSQAVQFRRNFRLMMAENNQTTINDLFNLPKPAKNSTIYIENVSDGISSFYVGVVGPGAVNNIIFNDPSLKTVLDPVDIDKSKPYMVLEYAGKSGNVKLLEKSSQ